MANQKQNYEQSDGTLKPASLSQMQGQQRQPQQQSVNPYAVGPTNYTGFQQYSNANAQASQNSANRLASKVSSEAQQAQAALQQQYGGYTQAVQTAANAGVSPLWSGQMSPVNYAGLGAGQRNAAQHAVQNQGTYTGPTGFTPTEGLEQQYLTAQHDLRALGSGAGGVQALMGPRASRFGAELVNAAGQPQFRMTQQQYAGLGSEIPAAQQRGTDAAKAAQKSMQQRIENQQYAAQGAANQRDAQRAADDAAYYDYYRGLEEQQNLGYDPYEQDRPEESI